MRHNFTLNYVHEIPGMKYGNRIAHSATSGWQISGVTSIRTGTPFTPGFSASGAGSANQTGSNTEGARIAVVAGCNPYTGSSDPFNRLNATCFFAPSPGSLGLESGQNWLYNPGQVQFDMSVERQFAPAGCSETAPTGVAVALLVLEWVCFHASLSAAPRRLNESDSVG